MRTRIAITRCQGYEYERVLKAVRHSIDLLGGIGRFVKPGQSVLLKPNLLIASVPEKGVTTHPMVVRAVMEIVKEAGGVPFVGDSPSFGSAQRVAAKSRIAQVAEAMGCPIVDFRETVQVRTPEGFTFRRFEVAREAVDSQVIINLPKIKTHAQMLLTLGVKNMFGCFPGTRKLAWHLKAGTDRTHFARMLVELYWAVKPDLTIMDGIVAMEGNGPSGGTTRPLDMVLAGTDCVSLDSTVTQLLGLPRNRLWTTRVGVEQGIGIGDPDRIEILGPPLSDLTVSHFVLPDTGDLVWGLPGFLKNLLKDVALPRPVIDPEQCKLCMRCVEICPPAVMKREADRIVIDTKACIRCFCCQEVCPEGAIEIQAGLGSRILGKGKRTSRG